MPRFAPPRPFSPFPSWPSVPKSRPAAARSRLAALAALAAVTLAAALVVGAPTFAQPGTVETLILFDPMAFHTPETVVVDPQGTLFIGSAFSAEIFKYDVDGQLSVFATLPLEMAGAPCEPGGLPALLGAVTLGRRGTLYANYAACDPGDRGVWRISPDGDAERIVPLGDDVLPNGIVLVGDRLYIADSLGSVLTATIDGGDAALWSDHPLLAEDPTLFAPGPNGIQYWQGELYIANSDTAQIVAFPIADDGTAGEPRVHAQLPFGCDDFAFDARGAIFCTTDPSNVVLEISPDGLETTVVMDAEDGLDGPTAAAFGRRPSDRFDLYVTNAAFPFFTVTNRPSLMKIELEHPNPLPVLVRQ